MYSFKYSKLLVTKPLLCKVNQKDQLFLATRASFIDGMQEPTKKINHVIPRPICIEAEGIDRRYQIGIGGRDGGNVVFESSMKVAAKIRTFQSQYVAQVSTLLIREILPETQTTWIWLPCRPSSPFWELFREDAI